MAKAVKTSKSKKVNSAYARSTATQKAAKDNESKISPTMEAGMTDMPGLAPDEGALKLPVSYTHLDVYKRQIVQRGLTLL